MQTSVDVGEGMTMDQVRAHFLGERILDDGHRPGPSDDVTLRLARIEAKLEALVGQNLESPSSSSPGGQMLTKKGVARRFQISTRTVDRWRSMGIDLGEITVRGTIRFDPAKITKIIATQKVKRRRRQ